jgi:TPR repeat protein
MREPTKSPSPNDMNGTAAAAFRKTEPVDGAWIQSTTAWSEARRPSRLWLASGVGLGVLGCFALVAAAVHTLAGGKDDAACQSANDCNARAAALLQSPDTSADDLALAARLLSRACDQGHAAACNNLGLAHQSAQGVPLDYDRARTAFQRACSAGFPEGCSNEGALYEHGLGVPANLGDAQRLYFQACKRGSALGCSNLGALYAQGRGVVADGAEASRFFAEACSRGSDVGCTNLFAAERSAPPEHEAAPAPAQ